MSIYVFSKAAVFYAPLFVRFCQIPPGGTRKKGHKKTTPDSVEKQFTAYLKKTISIRDTYVHKGRKENFYHGILLGLLGFKSDWAVMSNRESGEGYSDILIEIGDEEIGIVIEVKYPDNANLEEGCRKALDQIETKNYEKQLRDEGMKTILKYGIACYKKRCRVACEKKIEER